MAVAFLVDDPFLEVARMTKALALSNRASGSASR